MPEMWKLCYTKGEKHIAVFVEMEVSVKNITLYGIEYYQKSVFKGSCGEMCFRIFKSGQETPMLTAVAWKGPYILEKTEEEPRTKEFPFSEEGLQQADEWLTGIQGEFQ